MQLPVLLAILVLAAAAPPDWARNKNKLGKQEKNKLWKQAKTTEAANSTTDAPKLTSELLKQMQSVCGQPANSRIETLIVGGDEATRNAWPWMARLNNKGSFTCGGSLVTNNHIVTAAHCVTRSKASDWEVVLGDHSQRQNDGTEQFIGVSKVSYHRRYNDRTVDNDVAVLTLARGVTFNDNISPVCLPNGMTFSHGDAAVCTGWGTMSEGGSASDALMQVGMPIISTEKCRLKEPYDASEITDSMICAGVDAGGKDACQGDSGGPLVCKKNNVWYLCGIVSWGYGCAREGVPGVYAKTSALESWINEELN